MLYPVSVSHNEILCSCCDCIIDTNSYHDFYLVDGEIFCEECFSERFAYCEDCGEWYDRDNMELDESSWEWYCNDCIRDHRKIHEYEYKPCPIFHGKTDNARYFGVELEVDDGGFSHENAGIIVDDIAGGEDECYCKEDCSLHDGFEIVSHPMTLGYHERFFPWGEITSFLESEGYTSHDNDTCGLHIHADIRTFEQGAIARFAYLINKFESEVVQFSRRSYESFNHWAESYPNGTEGKTVSEWFDETEYYHSRYYGVNLQNDHTIELRVNKGTLNRDTIIASIQMYDCMIDICNHFDDVETRRLEWHDIANMMMLSAHEELKAYLVKRELI